MTIASTIEIIEKVRSPLDESNILIPNDVRINGQSVYASAEHPVVVERVEASGTDAVYVTLTLLARRVIMTDEQVTVTVESTPIHDQVAAYLAGQVKQFGSPQSDPEAARAFLDSIGPAEPTEARFIVAPGGETTDCCSESHNSFNVFVTNPAPERAIDYINQRFDGINS